jgi:lysophospholipase L1-like esterase
LNRRDFLLVSAAAIITPALKSFAKPAASAARTTTTTATTQPKIPDDVIWHNVRDWGIEGRAFNDTENYFDRLPARAKKTVRPAVWDLSHNTAGMSARFESDTDAIYLRYEVTNPRLAMAHMPATGVSGVDIYAQLDHAADKTTWRWLQTHHPANPAFAGPLQTQIAPGKRLYQINLPLYNGVKALEIGVPKSAAFNPIPPRKDKPILFYGTSITQGGCASRPGMSFVNILGRRLDRPILNFGFSGNGRMETAVGELLAELDPAIFVIDCIANMTAQLIADNTAPLVKLLRSAHAKTPILLLDERAFDNSPLLPDVAKVHHEKSDVLKKAFDSLVDGGVENLHFRAGGDLLGIDGEATVDGSHPNDLGMMRYADALEPDLKKLLP